MAWERFGPTSDYIHRYGCRLASGQNDRDRVQGRFKDDSRKIYCGACQMRGKAIRALAVTEGLNEIVSADVIHHIENGEISHTDLKIVVRENSGYDVEGTKTAILERLWNACHGPLTHVCLCDADLV